MKPSYLQNDFRSGKNALRGKRGKVSLTQALKVERNKELDAFVQSMILKTFNMI